MAGADRVTSLLTAAVVGVYLLVVVGATTAVLDGAATCATWPACDGAWIVPFTDPALVAAWGHRVATLVVATVLVAAIVATIRHPTPRRVRAAVGVAAVLYPLQVAVGAILAVTGAPDVYAVGHLVVAMTIVSTLLVALLWQLEARTDADTDPLVETPDTDDDPTPATTATAAWTWRDTVGAYVGMMKPRLMWLLCLVALAAMGLAAGPALDPGTAVATLAGGVLAIGASGTYNHVLERDVDAEMARTNDRPLVHEQIPVTHAIAFAIALTLASAGVFLVFVNALAAGLGLLAILFYSVIYTVVLKPNTTQNIVIGGAVGAFPALIGWAAVTNTVGIPAIVLGAVIFLWTPAHFYNLALAYADDYAAAGFPMLPVVRGATTTRRHILLYLGATLLAAVILGAITRLSWVYAVTIVGVATVFLVAVIDLFERRTERSAIRAFHASNAYLGALLVAVVVDTIVV
ncbi:MAG: heme o synthase [Halobacteriaceae archaeon]